MSMQFKIQIPIRKEKRGWSQMETIVFPDPTYINMLKQWCKECVGVNGWNYFGQYRKVPYEFRFKRSEDLLAFKLAHGL